MQSQLFFRPKFCRGGILEEFHIQLLLSMKFYENCSENFGRKGQTTVDLFWRFQEFWSESVSTLSPEMYINVSSVVEF